MNKSLIVAMTPSGIIGRSGALPWPRLEHDLPRFKRLTMGKPCIMGRKTFESIGKPLPGRTTIVVSRNRGWATDGTVYASSVLEAWIKADELKADEAFIVGGAEVYKQALPSCNRIYLTLLEREFPGDTRFELNNLRELTITARDYVDGPIPYQNIILERGQPPMTQFLTLERLDHNPLPIPRYGTQHSAGVDFAACLTRPCMVVEPSTGDKKKFWVTPNNDGAGWVRLDYDPDISNDRADKLAVLMYPHETVLVPLGFKCAFDNSCVLKLYPRSSVGLRGLVLANGTGIVDPDYRGELFAALVNRTNKPFSIRHGERIVQGVLTHFSQAIIREGTVDVTVRGEGGLGSTGKMAGDNLLAIQRALAAGPQPESVPDTTTAEDGPDPDRLAYG